jgi:predicted DNA-binding protein (MmcQ/YjbR family)
MEHIESYCRTLPHSDVEYKVEWDATKCMIQGKMYALIGHDKEGHEILTIKQEPTKADFLRCKYDDIVPGYYMNKQHWVSIRLSSSLDDKLLEDLLVEAHTLVFSSLPKKIQTKLNKSI